jgi:hypothetical protein
MKKLFILFFIIFGTSCSTYFSPERYANPKHKFESGNKKFERKMRRAEKRENRTIDPLRFHH